MSVVAVAVVALLLAAQLLNRTSENVKNNKNQRINNFIPDLRDDYVHSSTHFGIENR